MQFNRNIILITAGKTNGFIRRLTNKHFKERLIRLNEDLTLKLERIQSR